MSHQAPAVRRNRPGTGPIGPTGATGLARVAGAVPAVALGAGLAAAIALRVQVAGVAGVRSPAAGLLFAAVLATLCVATGAQPGGHRMRPVPSLAAGLAATAALCAVPLVVHLRTPGGSLGAAGLLPWVLVVSLVAVAEEALLRGRWWAVLERLHGPATALLVTTVAFGLLHVPLYGWPALPLDLAVGLLLGGLRLLTGRWSVPALAHALADLAGWWLR